MKVFIASHVCVCVFFSNVEIIKFLPEGHKMNDPSPLFTKIEPAKVEEFKKLFAGKQNGNGKVEVEMDVASLEAVVLKQVRLLWC